MIAGSFTRSLDPIVKATVVGVDASETIIEFLLDSGFNGFLSLPETTISSLGWRRERRQRAKMAHGISTRFDIYRGIIIWNDQPRIINVVASDSTPLIGTGLLEGSLVTMEVKPHGRIQITPLL